MKRELNHEVTKTRSGARPATPLEVPGILDFGIEEQNLNASPAIPPGIQKARFVSS